MMSHRMMTIVGMVLAGGAFASPIGEALRPIAESGKVPGICTAVCDAKGKVTVDCVGYANIEKKTPITEDTIFWIASDTKGIAGTLVLTFIQEGKIGLDDPVEKYFPGWKELYVCEKLPDGKYGPRRRATTKPTVRNLISHTAGLPFLPGGPIDTRSMSLMANMVPSRNLICEPNTKYNYSNWGIDCALAIVELVTGRPWEVSLQERILDPLGMKTATFWPKEDDAPGAVLATAYVMDTNRVDYLKPVKTVNMRHPYDDPHRYAEGGGGLFMSTRDYMKFCKMLLDGGRTPDGKTILNDASMKMLLTKQTPDCEKTSYGFGFFSDVANRRLWHGGAFNTGYTIDFKNHTAEVFHWQAPGSNADTKSARAIYYQAMRKFLAESRKTKVLFFFDTEDFTCDRSNDAIRDIANILKDEGVRGNFAMIGYLGQYLLDMKRTDVIEALSHHLVGSQTLYHSKHPNIQEYTDVADYATAYRRTMEEESRGFELLGKALVGQRVNWCSVFPGNANSYVGLYVHSRLGSPFFGGGNLSFTPGERQAAWFVNQFHLPYYKKLHLESFIPPQKPLDLAASLDALSRNDIVTLYMHPHMALSKQHWDGPNFDPRHPVEWGKWLPTPKRDEKDVAIYYDRLRALVHALKNDLRFEVTDCERLYATFRPRQPITVKDVPTIRQSLLRRLGPIGCQHTPWCVADAFQGVVKLLRGEASHTPGYVYGFLEPPVGVTGETEVSAADLRSAAKAIDLETFVPPSIEVGGRRIGPADFLLAALEVLETGADKVKVSPRDQLGPIEELMPSLATYTTKGGWPLYEDTFEDRYVTPRLRLQLWTLRYEW